MFLCSTIKLEESTADIFGLDQTMPGWDPSVGVATGTGAWANCLHLPTHQLGGERVRSLFSGNVGLSDSFVQRTQAADDWLTHSPGFMDRQTSITWGTDYWTTLLKQTPLQLFARKLKILEMYWIFFASESGFVTRVIHRQLKWSWISIFQSFDVIHFCLNLTWLEVIYFCFICTYFLVIQGFSWMLISPLLIHVLYLLVHELLNHVFLRFIFD